MFGLVGVDGNAFSVMGYTKNAMKKCGFSKNEQADYLQKAMSGDYDNLLAVSLNVLDECNRRCPDSI